MKFKIFLITSITIISTINLAFAQTNSENVESYLRSGETYIELQQYKKAVDVLNDAIKIGTSNHTYDNYFSHNSYLAPISRGYFDRGIAYFQMGEYDKADADFASSHLGGLMPSISLADIGDIKYKAGEYDQAIRSYTIAIRLRPDFAEAYYNRATAKEKFGDKGGAKLDYEKAKELGFKPKVK